MAIRIPIVTDFNSSGIKKAVGSLTGLEKMALQATGALAALGAAGAVVAIREFAKFDAKMTQSLAIMGDVSETLRGEMVDAARTVAKETTFSAEQAAESYFFLASAGLDAEASIAALPQVAAFAQAGMFDMARATDLATDAQSALGLSSDNAMTNLEELTRITDVLVKANTLANASVEQFGIALTTKAGSSAKALGIEVEEVVAVLSAFADQGIKAELAGNAFSIVVRDLTTKALSNADAFEQFGVVVFDTEGELRNMADIVENLEDVLAGLNDEQQKATLLALGFSDRSVTNIQALLGTSDAIREYEAELQNANGTTQEIAENQLETFNSQLQLLQSALADTAIEIGGILIPIVEDLVDIVNDQIIPALQDFAEYLKTPEGQQQLENIRTALVNIADASIKISIFIGDNINKLGQLLIILGAARVAWGVLVTSVILYNSSTLGAVAATNALRTALTRTGIGALVVALGFAVDGLINVATETGVVNEGDLSDLEKELLDIETQANNAAGAISGMQILTNDLIPASNTGQIDGKPENPQPGQRYTWFNYSGENGQAVWWQQTWTGTEWTKPEKMTYTPASGGTGGGTPRKTAADFIDEFFAGIDESVAQQMARMELADLGLSDALIEKIVGAQGWEYVYQQVIEGGTAVAEALQEEFNKTAEGIREIGRAAEEAARVAEQAAADLQNRITAQAEAAYNAASRAAAEHNKKVDELENSVSSLTNAFRESQEIPSGLPPLQQEILDFTDSLREAVNSAEKGVLGTRNRETLLQFIDDQETAMMSVARLRGDLEQERLSIEADLRTYGSIYDSLYESVIGTGQITSMGTSARVITARLADAIEDAKAFQQNISQLRQQGLSRSLLEQIEAAGIQAGGATAEALIKGGPDAVAEINALYSELESTADIIGTEAADSMFSAGQDMMNGLLEGIIAQENQVAMAAEYLATTFSDTFNSALQDGTVRKVAPSLRAFESFYAEKASFQKFVEEEMFARGVSNVRYSPGDEVFGAIAPIAPKTRNEGGVNITINAGVGTDGTELGRIIVDAITRYESTNGKVFANA